MYVIYILILYMLDLVKYFEQIFVQSKTLICPLCFVLRKATDKEVVTQFF